MPGATVAGIARPIMVLCAGLVQSNTAAETAVRSVEENSIFEMYNVWMLAIRCKADGGVLEFSV